MADFEKLYSIIPTTVESWDKFEVNKWLEFIKLPQYRDNFMNAEVNGQELVQMK